MDYQLLDQYLTLYIERFNEFSHLEIYKWEAIKCFQDHWDPERADFGQMLGDALARTQNLLASGNYYPVIMIIQYANAHPHLLRDLFAELFDEEADLIGRIQRFMKGTKNINDQLFPGKLTYQDFRAIMVYLTLRYPNRYYFYKHKMVKEWALKFNLPFKPKGGKIENILQYNNYCEIIRATISQNQQLIKLHADRLSASCYYDEDFHILTQDFVYAVSKYLVVNELPSPTIEQEIEVSLLDSSTLEIIPFQPSFSGSITNYLKIEEEKKRIGNLGEIFVLEYEENQLKKAGLAKWINKITHDSIKKGDGLGYDIKSVTSENQEKYIEVKTTTKEKKTPFFITRTELERSKMEKGKYYLYRVYNFNPETNHGDIEIYRGELTPFCQEPNSYRVELKSTV